MDGQLLDRLVCGPVFADADGVMCEDVDDGQLHEGAQAEGAAHIVDEDQKAGAVGPDLYQAHAVHHGRHGVLANAEVEVARAVIFGRKISGAVERKPGLGGWSEVGGSANEPRDVLRECVQNLARGFARGQTLGVCRKLRDVLVPSLRQLPVLHAVQLVGQVRVLLAVLSDPREPGVAKFLAALAHAVAEVLVNAGRNIELLVLGPAVVALGEADFLFAEGLAVGAAGVLLVRGAVGDVAVDDDQRRPVLGVEEVRMARAIRPRSLASPTRVTFHP